MKLGLDARYAVSGATQGQPRSPTTGQYGPGAKAEIIAMNREIANRVHAEVVDILGHQPWLRPNVSTGRLLRVTAARQNVFVANDGSGWGVGRVDYLNRSYAKYWRTIEEGSAATWSRGGMIGMVIYGFWYSRLGEDRKGKSFRSPAGSGDLIPNVGKGGGRGWDAETRQGGGKLRGVTPSRAGKLPPMVISKEIEGIHYYSRAWNDSDVPQRTISAVREIISNAIAQTARIGLEARGHGLE